LPGVEDVQVDLTTDRFTVTYVAIDASVEQMHEAVRSLGYTPTTVSSKIEVTAQSGSAEIPEPVKSAVSEAKANNKLLLLDFQAIWCGACKIMERTTFADQGVKKVLKNYVFLKVDADSDATATNHFNVRGLPTLVVIDGSGHEKYRHIGPIAAEELEMVLSGLKSEI